MIVHRCEQGGSDWLELRAGIPTASQFDCILTKSGKPSASAEKYMHKLLAERILGKPLVEHVSMWMQRGSDLEADAVNYYEFQCDCTTEPIGFITDDCRLYGASPDRLVGEDGLLEIKCPAPQTHVGYLLCAAGASDEYKVQTQGQLWVTGRQYVDVLSYCPGMPEALIRITRDDDFIGKLSCAVAEFSVRLEAATALMIERGWIKPKVDEPTPHIKYGQFINDDDLAWALERSIPAEQTHR